MISTSMMRTILSGKMPHTHLTNIDADGSFWDWIWMFWCFVLFAQSLCDQFECVCGRNGGWVCVCCRSDEIFSTNIWLNLMDICRDGRQQHWNHECVWVWVVHVMWCATVYAEGFHGHSSHGMALAMWTTETSGNSHNTLSHIIV